MSVGLRVLRGPDWSSEDRDGGEGHLGTVVSVGGEGTCEVLWDSGKRCMCRIGKFGKHDLRIFDNATIGVRHSSVFCDGCETQGIAGMKWTCAQCKRCNLCALCYVTDKHDLSHEFLRYDTPTSEGVKVKKRSASLKIRAMGLFPGAHVVRGPDWNSANLDGGDGKVGQIISLPNSVSTPTTRNMVKVKWPNGEVSSHRVGYQGKVDLQYTDESPGTYYYKEHLPYLDSDSAQQTPVRQPEVLQVGDKVYIHVPAASLKALQSDRSGWTSGMANCIGKVGILKGFAPSGDATVEFGGMRFRFTPEALRKIPNLKQGDVVKLISEEDRVKTLQDGHGGWISDLKQVLGKCGKIVRIDDDGDVLLAFGKRTFLLNPACCVPAPGEKVFELVESASSPRSSGSGVTDTHADLLKLMAAMMMKDVTEHLATDPDLLYQAIGKGDVGMVRSIVSKAPKMLNVKHKGVTPLILAAHEGQFEVVKALLDLGADTSLTDGKGHTALHAALIGWIPNLKQGDVVKLISEEDRVKTLQDGHGGWISDLKQVLGKCGKIVRIDDDGDVLLAFGKRTFLLNPACCVPAPGEKVFELVESASSPRSSGSGVTDTHADLLKLMAAMMMKDVTEHLATDPDLLYQAIGKGDVGMVRSIVSKAPKMLNVKHKGVTPLILAAHEGQFEVVKALLDLGADTSLTDGKGHTALHAALIGKKEKTAQLLLEKGASVQVCNNQNRTALHFAAFANLPNVVMELIKKGCNVNAKDVAGDTALHDAIQKGNREAVDILMRAAKIDLRIPNKRGFNPLQFAAFTGNTSAVQAILKRDTGVVNLQKGEDRFAALHIAAINDHVECARLLIDMGKASVNIQGANGSTALHLACHEGLYRTAELLLEKAIHMEVLDSRMNIQQVTINLSAVWLGVTGADPNVRDEDGNTALHITLGAEKSTGSNMEHRLLAALLGLTARSDDEARVKLACLLLQKKAIVDAKNNRGATPLEVAKSPTVRQAVQLFIRQNQGSIQRSTPSNQQGLGARIRMGSTMFDMHLPCAKCMNKMADITLMPCGHKVLCRQCCLITEICPLCEKHIERRLAKREHADLDPPCKVQ